MRRFSPMLGVASLLAGSHGCGHSAGAVPYESVARAEAESAADTVGPLIEAHLRRHAPQRQPYLWGTAILMLGVARLAEVDPTRRSIYLDHLERYHREHDRGEGPRVLRPDHCASARSAVLLSSVFGRSEGQVAASVVYAYLRGEGRNRLGAIDHLGEGTALSRLYPRSIWIDSLMVYATTAADLALDRGDPELLQFALSQPRIFAGVLQDPTSGLFRHAYLLRSGRTRPTDPVFWLRGNGWAAAAMVDLLEVAPGDHPERAAIEDSFVRLMEGLERSPRVDGLWPTVLGHDRAYPETSGTALVGYAMAKGERLGIGAPRHRALAFDVFEALVRTIEVRRGRPVLTGTSIATHPSSAAGYRLVPRAIDVDYGVGALALLAAELSSPSMTGESGNI